MDNININIKVPTGEYCYSCRFKRINGLIKKTECMIFDEVLKEIRIENSDLCLKCQECTDESMNDYYDEE